MDALVLCAAAANLMLHIHARNILPHICNASQFILQYVEPF